jgi:putative mRNA 3-end processing factor
VASDSSCLPAGRHYVQIKDEEYVSRFFTSFRKRTENNYYLSHIHYSIMASSKLLRFTDKGIYVPRAKVYIDPWKPVDYAIITHAHADHARPGMKYYLAHHDSVPILRIRLGSEIKVEGKKYNESVTVNGVKFTLFPAGHIVGSAQVRVEYKEEIWVVSGDYKREKDQTCVDFEPVACTHFITESTFGLPVYRWPKPDDVFAQINEWWSKNKASNKNSILLGYSLGKAQRLINGLDQSLGTVYTHGAVENVNVSLREQGVPVNPTQYLGQGKPETGSMIVAPPSAAGSSWTRRFEPYSLGMASGWMMLRGTRRRRNADRGFILSDHADWDGLIKTIKETGAENIYVTHGYSEIFSQYLNEQGWNAQVVKTEFEGELLESDENSSTEDRSS